MLKVTLFRVDLRQQVSFNIARETIGRFCFKSIREEQKMETQRRSATPTRLKYNAGKRVADFASGILRFSVPCVLFGSLAKSLTQIQWVVAGQPVVSMCARFTATWDAYELSTDTMPRFRSNDRPLLAQFTSRTKIEKKKEAVMQRIGSDCTNKCK